MTSHAIRRIQQEYHRAPNSPLIAKLFRANEKLVSQYSIDQHLLKGLANALKAEKKRRKRGKRLNLIGQEEGGPQFFSPSQIEAARAQQVLKDAKEAQKQQSIQDKKARAAINKQEKIQRQKIAAERRLEKAANEQVQKSLKESLKSTNHKQVAIRKQLQALPKAPNKRKKQPIKPQEIVVADRGEEVILATSSGRRVQRPKRLAD
jgi:hypothetical protein